MNASHEVYPTEFWGIATLDLMLTHALRPSQDALHAAAEQLGQVQALQREVQELQCCRDTLQGQVEAATVALGEVEARAKEQVSELRSQSEAQQVAAAVAAREAAEGLRAELAAALSELADFRQEAESSLMEVQARGDETARCLSSQILDLQGELAGAQEAMKTLQLDSASRQEAARAGLAASSERLSETVSELSRANMQASEAQGLVLELQGLIQVSELQSQVLEMQEHAQRVQGGSITSLAIAVEQMLESFRQSRTASEAHDAELLLHAKALSATLRATEQDRQEEGRRKEVRAAQDHSTVASLEAQVLSLETRLASSQLALWSSEAPFASERVDGATQAAGVDLVDSSAQASANVTDAGMQCVERDVADGSSQVVLPGVATPEPESAQDGNGGIPPPDPRLISELEVELDVTKQRLRAAVRKGKALQERLEGMQAAAGGPAEGGSSGGGAGGGLNEAEDLRAKLRAAVKKGKRLEEQLEAFKAAAPHVVSAATAGDPPPVMFVGGESFMGSPVSGGLSGFTTPAASPAPSRLAALAAAATTDASPLRMYLPLPPKQHREGGPQVLAGPFPQAPAVVQVGDAEATMALVHRVTQLEAELQGAAKKVAIAPSLTARVGDLSSTIDSLQV